MSIIEQIKAEIERLYDGEAPKHDQQCDFDDGYFTGIGAISQFIDTLESEKPIPNVLEEAARDYAWDDYGIIYEGERVNGHIIDRVKDAFIAGAKWQKEKDLALTWKDMKCIDEIMSAIITSVDAIDLASWDDERYYTEVLNRFNKSKEGE